MDQNSSCNYCKKKVIGFVKGSCRYNLLSKQPHLSCGNKYIDAFIQDTKSKRKHCDDFIEWIPCSEIEIYDLIIEGGYSKIFIGKWDPLKREDKKKLSNINIVLKVLKGSENFDLKFLNELKIHYQCLGKCSVPFYGLTKLTRMQEYAMVMKYTIHGDLNKFLNSHSKLSWIKRVEILQNIAKSLNELHKLNIIHRDFHSGNILVDDNMEIFISDFGLSKFVNDLELSNSTDLPSEPVKGVLPYIAPEVLIGKPYTKKSDIYSLGIIMWELTSRDRPFSNRSHDILLAMDIIYSKLRPKIVERTPEIYQDMMELCWNEDPLKRPDLSQLINDYENMIKNMEQSDQPVMSDISGNTEIVKF
ncbi:kinase-like domain-containing protein [Gigaspora rosea]|uniref:Kinase-like domain-containing protein n=1 Tax=Gigaspora rosea TaxID=44941 RepID=A0A397UGQ6_9GLOM|nr:kinase-like domain-containing protein [Gigaspora rosea]